MTAENPIHRRQGPVPRRASAFASSDAPTRRSSSMSSSRPSSSGRCLAFAGGGLRCLSALRAEGPLLLRTSVSPNQASPPAAEDPPAGPPEAWVSQESSP
jgi:hypothetical protein